jgi:hypothetical protein
MKKIHQVNYKGGKSAKIPPPAPIAEIEEKEPDVLVTGSKKKRQDKKEPSKGLNRFLITPGGSTGSGANVPE